MNALGVVAQVRRAFAVRNRLALLVGFLLGGFVPLAIYFVAHAPGAGAPEMQSRVLPLVGGGLLYSAQTVFQWARNAFSSALKSVGFCVLVEGVMLFSPTHWLAVAALAYLVLINGVATGCTLSLGRPRALKGRS